MTPADGFDAVVLAGGAARRLDGADKPQLRVGDATLLDRVIAAVGGARAVVVAGPRQPTSWRPGGVVTWCREDPPGSGPVAAVAAALPHVAAERVLLLAADLPWVAPAVPRLLATLDDAPAAALVDDAGRVNHLAAAWRTSALRDAVAALPGVAGAPLRALSGQVALRQVRDDGGWGRDCDTWDDLAAARARADRMMPS